MGRTNPMHPARTPTRLIAGSLKTERLENGRRRILQDFTVAVGGTDITVEKGFTTDFSSFPWWASFVVHWSKVDIAGVVHDWLYCKGTVSRLQADRIWYLVAIAGKHHANCLQAVVGWLGLVLGGWYQWNKYNMAQSMNKVQTLSIIIYILGFIGWFILWWCIGACKFAEENTALWFPFGAASLILLANIVIVIISRPLPQRFQTEVKLIEFVERHAAHLVAGSAGVFIIASTLMNEGDKTVVSNQFVLLMSTSLITAVVGVLPIYWISSSWGLTVLRHFKTVPFTYSVCLFLAALLTFVNDIL